MESFKTCLEDIKLNRFICDTNNEEIKTFINFYDENGRTLLHWAAFLGKKNDLFNLLKNGANPLLISENEENFQAIHFAAVNNHIDCIQILLDFGVSIESCDMFRRTPLSVSAFYGRITASVFLLSKKANVEHQDLNGNNPLHFAALSGNSDLCQIFLYSGIDIHIKNDFGETPFHLACRRGSKRLIKLLLSNDRQLLRVIDNKGINPVGHAKFNQNQIGLKFLQDELKKLKIFNFSLKKTDLLYGRGGSKYSLVFVIAMIFFWAIPFYVKNVLYLTYSEWPILNWALIIDCFVFMFNFYAVNSIEPGYLPRYTKEYDEILKNVSLKVHNESEVFREFSRLCHTCRTVKPLRSSHCGFCKRCVRHKDHHCPYVYNCIGFKNRQFFLCFLISLWIGLSLGIAFALILYFQFNFKFQIHEYFGMCLMGMFYLFVNVMMISTVLGSLRNITSNEAGKWKKYGYEYLRDEVGNFHNQFDKGMLLNFLEFFRIIVEFLPDKRAPFIV